MFGSLIFIAIISFLITFLVSPRMKLLLEYSGILGIDQQKKNKPRIATSGGLCVIAGFIGGLMSYIAADTFFIKTGSNIVLILAVASSVLIAIMIGLLDDLHIRRNIVKAETGTRDYRMGLKQWQKPLLTIAVALPLMVVSAGQSTLHLPILGAIKLDILFPLIIIPIAVICVTNATNMLAGLNGLETGLGFIASLFLAMYIFLFGQKEGAIIAMALSFSLLGFLKYNWYPAKILPGDSLTYLIGAGFISAVIIGNVEKFGIIIFLPWILEAFLKLRGEFKVQTIGILEKNGNLKNKYKKVYSLPHFLMNGKFKEHQIVSIILIGELLICILAILFIRP